MHSSDAFDQNYLERTFLLHNIFYWPERKPYYLPGSLFRDFSRCVMIYLHPWPKISHLLIWGSLEISICDSSQKECRLMTAVQFSSWSSKTKLPVYPSSAEDIYCSVSSSTVPIFGGSHKSSYLNLSPIPLFPIYCLSQPPTLVGIVWKSVEHFYQDNGG